MEAIAEATNILRYPADGARPSLKEVVTRINSLDWSNDNGLWDGVLVQASGKLTGGNKVITGNGAMKFAARFAYQIGWKPEAPELKALKRDFKLNTGGRAGPDGEIQGGKDFPPASM